MSTFTFGDYKINVPSVPSNLGLSQGVPQGSSYTNTKNKKSSSRGISSRRSRVTVTRPVLSNESQIYREANTTYVKRALPSWMILWTSL